MVRKTRFEDLLQEFRLRHRSLWNSLALIEPDAWQEAVLAGGRRPQELLQARLEDDHRLLQAVEAAAVGLPETTEIAASSPELPSSPTALLDKAAALAERLDAMLATLDNQQWQRKVRGSSGLQTVATLVEDLNAAYSAAEVEVEAYLGSFERLGKEGLKAWLLRCYDAIMDSVAGLSEEEIMGPSWCGRWNTYQVLLHVWSWQDVALAAARRWHEPAPTYEVLRFPDIEAYNDALLARYQGKDMVAVADGLVTSCRQTILLVERSPEGLLRRSNILPWSKRRETDTLCGMLYTIYRHTWDHAWEICEHRDAEDPERPPHSR
ncbi:MAG: hypothetical protein D6775_06910 [Caldilineae bacterium]|nr:MAG: hypothetical protein D6775_06910 [Caldilineae bacterium]